MKLLIGLVSFLTWIATFTVLAAVNLTDYENNIVFRTWNNQGAQLNFTFSNNDSFTQMCPPPSNWTIISHAFQEVFESKPWPQSIVDNFIEFRGGCVMFMDYRVYTNLGSAGIGPYYDGIVNVVTRKFRQLEQLGYKASDAFLFANGYSSHIFFSASYGYSPCTIGRIEACDAANSAYLTNPASEQLAKKSAKNVICYHTSNSIGTDKKYCHKDIDMGRCGVSQPASLYVPYTDHELCPYFYNSTFKNDFDIVPKSTVQTYYSTTCNNKTVVPQLLPNEAIHVGPRMKTCIPNGEYYVLTSNVYPYNVPSTYSA